MAEVTKGTAKPAVATRSPGYEHRINGLIAGEAIVAGDACRIHTDGKAYKASGAAANASAIVRGFAATDASSGEAVTLMRNVVFGYKPLVSSTAMNPGAQLYLSGTVAGGLADTASTGGTTPIAFVIDTDGRIMVTI